MPSGTENFIEKRTKMCGLIDESGIGKTDLSTI